MQEVSSALSTASAVHCTACGICIHDLQVSQQPASAAFEPLALSAAV